MTEQKKPRKTQYELGFDEAHRRVLLVMSSLIDNYPNPLSPATLQMIGTTANGTTYHTVVEALERFAVKLQKEARRRQKTEAIA